MQKRRKIQITMLLILVIAVASISIAYAVLSTSLNITGTGEVTASTWDIRLQQGESSSGANSASNNPNGGLQSISYGKKTITYSIKVSKPGDYVKLFFNIKNYGTINGEIVAITHGTPICTSDTGNKIDEELICNNLIYEVNHFEANMITLAPISSGDIITSQGICLNGITTGVSERTSQIKVTLNPDMTAVPSSTVTVSNISTTFDIVQTDKECDATLGSK